MMSDVFMEYMVKKKYDNKDKLIIGGIVFAGVILTFVLFVLMLYVAATGFSMAFSIGLLFVAGVWYGAYLLIGKRNVEYEYILTNSEMDIDKIMAKRGRKRVASFDFKNAEMVACIKDNEHNHSYKNNEFAKVLDFSGNNDFHEVYFADIVIDGTRTIILFQPTERMIESIKVFNPRKVFIMNK